MVRIRTVEEAFLKLHAAGRIRGTVHTCLGQEAVAVGVMGAIDREIDVVFSSHRAHGHFLAYGGPIDGLVAEVAGREAGVSHGIGGTQHLHFKNFYSSGIQGGIVPPAVGAAIAEKKKRSGAIVIVFLGDGTMGQGTVYESFQMATLFSAPVLFVIENNQYAQSTPVEQVHKSSFSDRAKGFGLPVFEADGNHLEEVIAVSGEAVDAVRRGMTPAVLHLRTYRLGPHSKGDDPRTEEEMDPHRMDDPISRFGKQLLEAERNAIEETVHAEVEGLLP